MGRLVFDEVTDVELDDRLLAHLKAAFGVKLRRREPFLLSVDMPGGIRASVTIAGDTAIRFRFDGTPPTDIDQDWLEKLVLAASSNAGITDMGPPRS